MSIERTTAGTHRKPYLENERHDRVMNEHVEDVDELHDLGDCDALRDNWRRADTERGEEVVAE